MRSCLGSSSAALSLALLTGCQVSTGGLDEDFSDGHIYVTGMLGHGCEYDDEKRGIVFEFTLTGHKDADMIAEVHRARPGADEHHPGPVIASRRLPIRDGEYENPVVMVVPLHGSDYDPKLIRCILQTENYGPEIVNAP